MVGCRTVKWRSNRISRLWRNCPWYIFRRPLCIGVIWCCCIALKLTVKERGWEGFAASPELAQCVCAQHPSFGQLLQKASCFHVWTPVLPNSRWSHIFSQDLSQQDICSSNQLKCLTVLGSPDVIEKNNHIYNVRYWETGFPKEIATMVRP